MAQAARRGRPAGVDGEQTRRRIMAVAAEYVAEAGYASATMKSIAERVGLTGAAIYRYFPSKQELVSVLLAEMVDDILGRLDRATQVPGTLQERFVSLLEESLACVRDYPAVTRLTEAVHLESARIPEFRVIIDSQRRAEEKLYARLVDGAIHRGELPPDTEGQGIADMLTSLTWGLTHLGAVVSPARHAAAIRQAEGLLASGSLLPRRS
ncbi:TetR/AcrR family transcriptional regulator [Streptomyces sp. NPDC056660]|uniref:TetR/AcrR family transcriptional regulator n=1 Tax=Streptomyces sp. NPDC056660 TaxID=3345897 RepID=UPI0036AF80A6